MEPPADDQEVGNQLRAGNRQAFERFYQTHSARLHNYLRRYLGDSRVAEDIAQEAFLNLWQRPNGFNPARGSLRAYLFGIAAKRAADWWRHHPPAAVSAPAPRAGAGDACVLMADALERMDAERRSLLWLREVEGYTYDELARLLGVPVGTVKSRLAAAREELRRIWKGEGPSGDL